jgi:MSHA biogenesis protein MshP
MPLQKQSGSAIVLAIFVIVIISLLGAALVSLQRDSAKGTSYEIYASRAYLSAYSASEIALTELFPLIPISASSAVPSCSNVSVGATLPTNDVGFHGCNAIISCKELAAVNSASLPTRYKVTSTAVCKNNQTITRRQIMVEASSL